MEKKYLDRIIDEKLNEHLEASGAVLIEGAKWCGKTRTAKEKANSILYMQDPDQMSANLKLADTKPSLLLNGDSPRLIDEWQMAPVLWDAVRHSVDQRGELGLYILTGSSVPKDNSIMHSGTGRISRILMRPMSLFESLESNGSISLKELFDKNNDIEGISNLSIEDIAFAIVRGGWPAAIGVKEKVALTIARQYVEAVINLDVSRVDGIEKSPARVRAVMRSLSRNISTLAKNSTIHNDILSDDDSVSVKTIASYINALRRIYVVEDLLAWNPVLRSKTSLRTSPKREFVDPSIAAATMRLTPASILEDFNTFGFLFEALCIRDLRVYAQSLDGDLFHYRDKSGLEADAVIHLRDGRWAAIEVKLGSKEIEEAAKHLLSLEKQINIEKMKSPSFLMILTGTKYAYKRKDGVYVVPIGCLRD